MFFSYQLPQLLTLGALLIISGCVFVLAARSRSRRWNALALGIAALDLLIASYGFNPASDPLLLDFKPPAIEFLGGQAGHFRVTSLERPGDGRILHPNTGLRYGLDDIRGYDSIIPAGYVATMRSLQPQHLLDHNQIAPLYTDAGRSPAGYQRVLQSDMLNLLNVRYVLTAPDFEMYLPGWKDVYRQEVAIWENQSVMPRAFVVDKADWNPRWLAEVGGGFKFAELDILGSGLHVPRYETASISRDSGREKFIDVSVANDSWLVVSESYMPGWRAFARPFGSGEEAEFGLAVRLVLANLQGLELPAGAWTLRLVYSPESMQLGMFTSSLSVAIILFMLGAWFWRATIGLNTESSSSVAKVARNSAAPIVLNLFNRGIDLAFAIVMYRLLLPVDVGIYNFAIVLFVAFDIFTNFGLDLFLIRAVSQQKGRAGYYLYNSSLFRLLLSLAGVPLLAGVMLLWQSSGAEAISSEGLVAIGLLYIGLFPASLSKGMTSLFYANEQAERPAAIATITTMNKAVFGVIALLLGYGIVGLAAISIFNNALTLLVLLWAGRKLIGRIGPRKPDRRLIREMVGESLPLMLNHFLATVFFQVDILILQALKGAETVAQYSTGYKWLLAINIVPSFFTQALFPVMSRQAQDDNDSAEPHFSLRHQAALRGDAAVGGRFQRARRAADADSGRRALYPRWRHRFAIDDLEHSLWLDEQSDAVRAGQPRIAAPGDKSLRGRGRLQCRRECHLHSQVRFPGGGGRDHRLGDCALRPVYAPGARQAGGCASIEFALAAAGSLGWHAGGAVRAGSVFAGADFEWRRICGDTAAASSAGCGGRGGAAASVA